MRSNDVFSSPENIDVTVDHDFTKHFFCYVLEVVTDLDRIQILLFHLNLFIFYFFDASGSDPIVHCTNQIIQFYLF